MTTNINWQDSAKTALTNLVDSGTNLLTGLAQSTKDRIQNTPTNTVPVYSAPPANDNMLLLLGAGVVLFLILKKKR